MTPLTIFKLPKTALHRLLSIMHPLHLFYLFEACMSSVEKRAIVKNYASNNYKLRIGIGELLRFDVFDSKNNEVKKTFYVVIPPIQNQDHNKRITTTSNDFLLAYDTKILEHASKVCSFLFEELSLPLHTVVIDFTANKSNDQRIVQWINESKVHEVLLLNKDNLQEARYSYWLRNLRCESLISEVDQCEKLQSENLPLCKTSLIVEIAQWVKLEHILNSKCIEIDLKSLLLTDEDLNILSKRIIDGSYSDFEVLLLFFDRLLDYNEILRNTGCHKVDRKCIKVEKRFDHSNKYGMFLNNGKRCLVLPHLATEQGLPYGIAVLQSNRWKFKTFKLLSLPYIPLNHVFMNCEPGEIFDIAQCSQRMKNVVIVTIKNFKYVLEIVMDDIPGFIVSLNSRESQFTLKKISELQKISKTKKVANELIGKEQGVPSLRAFLSETDVHFTYWTDLHYGSTQMYDALRELFNFKTTDCHVKVDNLYKDFKTVNNWIFDKIPKLHVLWFEQEYGIVNDECLLSMLNKNKSTTALLYLKPTQNFRAPKLHKEVKEWFIQSGHWITQETLMSLNFEIFWIKVCALTDQQLNDLLKHWLLQPNQLKFVNLLFNRILRHDVILEGIKVTPVTEFKQITVFGVEFSNKDGFEVMHDNTHKFSICLMARNVHIMFS